MIACMMRTYKPWAEAKAWIAERARKEQQVEHVTGILTQFLVEPFVPHAQDTEYYININSVRDVSPDNVLVIESAANQFMQTLG